MSRFTPALTDAMVYAGITLLVQVPRTQPRHWRMCCGYCRSQCTVLRCWRKHCTPCWRWCDVLHPWSWCCTQCRCSLDALHHRRSCCSRSRGWCDVSTIDAVAAIMEDLVRRTPPVAHVLRSLQELFCRSWCDELDRWRTCCSYCRGGEMCSTTGGRQASVTCTSLRAQMLRPLQELVR